MNLYQASNQWATRPADERFWTLDEARAATYAYHKSAAETRVVIRDLRVAAQGTEVVLVGPKGGAATLTHWAFGQLAIRAGAPAAYLRTLPAALVEQNLAHGLALRAEDDETRILMHRNGHLIVRAFNGDDYTRVWNYEVLDRLVALRDANPTWRVPPARPAMSDQPGTRRATEADVLMTSGGGGLSINVGDLIAPAGIYASDHDMFVLLINEANRIEDGSAGGLSRGIIVTNSEVGAASITLRTFFFRHVCGNHIIWDVTGVKAVRVRHVGRVRGRAWGAVEAEMRTYANTAAGETERAIAAARVYRLAPTRAKLIERVFEKDILSKVQAERAYDAAAEHDEDPLTAWGFVQGVTYASQATTYMDERVKMEQAVQPIMRLAA